MDFSSIITNMSVGTVGAAAELTLDPNLKYWVLFPISIVMILVGVCRQYIMVLLGLKIKTYPRARLTEVQYMSKAQALLGNGTNLCLESFKTRQEYLAQLLADGKFLAQQEQPETPPNPLTDPNATDVMMNMLKSNLANYIPQTLTMWWVNHFFAGFLLMKLPFPLTIKFKEMLQNGIMTPDLDPRWVSSISWYVISTLGLAPVTNLLFSSNSEESEAFAIAQQQQQFDSAPGAPTPEAIMKSLANDITIAQHESCFDTVESRVLNLYAK
ncbi:LANO_0F15742g1_1 [Lachancea nothofagi CBS 11611]|uniref:ER membrane protein complex subunit 3 n=1 Tax=Lachancea nothofagi CBS 11611 TaxID=1266666 RepID=A0A1G4KCP3_9SACH|nr:LANO_0F15742g1_1 [Lachancea nothofagi CBS 11611]